MNDCAGKWCGAGYDGQGHTPECLAEQEKLKTAICSCGALIRVGHVFCESCARMWQRKRLERR